MPLLFRTSRSRAAVAALALSALALAGCSDSGSSAGGSTSSSAPLHADASGAAPVAAAKNTITIDNFKFMPSKLSVKTGARITATNEDTTAHTVTGTGSAKFDTGHIAPGKKKTFTAPKKAGSYPFHCSIHPFMKGTLKVS